MTGVRRSDNSDELEAALNAARDPDVHPLVQGQTALAKAAAVLDALKTSKIASTRRLIYREHLELAEQAGAIDLASAGAAPELRRALATLVPFFRALWRDARGSDRVSLEIAGTEMAAALDRIPKRVHQHPVGMR